MARHVFAANRRPNWQLAEKLITALGDEELHRAGSAYGIHDLGAIRGSLFSGLHRLHAEWDTHFFLEGGVISADTTELDGLAIALTDLGIAQTVGLTVTQVTGLTVNTPPAHGRAVSDRRTRAVASRRRP